MAQRRNPLNSEKFSCSICLDLLKDPVTTSCGHSYCMRCIKTHWDGETGKRTYSCPQCRKNFKPRPVLEKNVLLAELVEELKKTRLQAAAAAADRCYAGPKDVACDVCTGRKMKAVKKHQLVKPSNNKELSRLNIQQRIQDRQKDMKLLQQDLEAINASADEAMEDNEKMFTQMIHLIQKRHSDVKQQIKSEKETEVSRVKELQEKLEQEIRDLKRKDAELKQFSDTPDHNQFLHSYPSVSTLSESTHSSIIDIRPGRHFEDVTAAVKKLRDQLQDILRDKWTNISLAVAEVDVLLSEPEPESRDESLKYSRVVTLDPNTANRRLLLSEWNRKVTVMGREQRYPDHPDRFTERWQVLSKESLTGRCYWEVEWRGSGVVVAVAYKNICKKADLHNCGFGQNDKSWSLRCDTNSYKFFYNNTTTNVSGPQSSRIGVYLDHRAGILSFYGVSKTITLLHRVQTTFTEPIHAGVGFLNIGATAEFLKLK
ncbi:tripartite motif-containing protein 16-like protein [Acanthochromis polyacanthus]|uniref:tripartite motif-containing protein 16-like protein n=1 Tax=Acanthochromis polyacanthus TaxID=80966 RepID=UPI0022345CC9|nr:tripartite motif-containing protein 16-like protein [Acanthochromis polyacanthus]